MSSLTEFLRPEVKGAFAKDDTLWFATLAGLYRWQCRRMEAVPAWHGTPLRALCKAQGGFLLVAGDRLVICDKHAAPVRELPPVPGDEAKSVLVDEKTVFAGGKTGIWRHDGEGWSKVAGSRPYEVIGLGKGDGRLFALVKKQGPAQTPALALSADGGHTWHHAHEGSYADLVRAVAGTGIVTQWGGVHALGDRPWPGKEPVTAAWTGPGVVATITGSKLELRHGGRIHLEIKAPVLAEAEILLVQAGHAVVAGVQGAYLVDLDSGAITDMFAGLAVPASAAKIKKLFTLGPASLLTTTFGTFHSTDGGASWQPVESDWQVLDAVGVAAEGGTGWWLAAQRGLFHSADGGRRWKHAKVSSRPHGFAEFTGIAFAAGRLALASKAGLFVSGPDGIKDLRAVPQLGRRMIAGVVADGAAFLVTDGEGGLFRFDPATGGLSALASLPARSVPLGVSDGRLLVGGKQGLVLWSEGGLAEVRLPETAVGEVNATGDGGRVLVWNGDRGWIGGAAGWRAIADWPTQAKSASLLADGGVLVTDRRAVYRCQAA
ncbi:MAG: hypothetical protein OHK0024_16200 [Thalassobaculales bacterium]